MALGFCSQIFLHDRDGVGAGKAGGRLQKLETFMGCAVLEPDFPFGEQLDGHLQRVDAGAAHPADAFVEFLGETDDLLGHLLAAAGMVESANLPDLDAGDGRSVHRCKT